MSFSSDFGVKALDWTCRFYYNTIIIFNRYYKCLNEKKIFFINLGNYKKNLLILCKVFNLLNNIRLNKKNA